MVHETKGDTVAPGAEGLLNLQPDDFVFYVGGYPSNFRVSLAWACGRPPCSYPSKSCRASGFSPSQCTELLLLGLSGGGGGALTTCCAHSHRSPSTSPAIGAALRWTRSTRRWSVSTTLRRPSCSTQPWTSLVPGMYSLGPLTQTWPPLC